MNRVGQIVKEKRTAAGLSQNKLAKIAGISQASLNALEATTSNPSVETVFLLAAALGCSVSELLGEKQLGASVLSGKEQQLLDLFQQLNETGQDFLVSQAESILAQPAFRKAGSISSAI